MTSSRVSAREESTLISAERRRAREARSRATVWPPSKMNCEKLSARVYWLRWPNGRFCSPPLWPDEGALLNRPSYCERRVRV